MHLIKKANYYKKGVLTIERNKRSFTLRYGERILGDFKTLRAARKARKAAILFNLLYSNK
jgi:hypothetical protein